MAARETGALEEAKDNVENFKESQKQSVWEIRLQSWSSRKQSFFNVLSVFLADCFISISTIEKRSWIEVEETFERSRFLVFAAGPVASWDSPFCAGGGFLERSFIIPGGGKEYGELALCQFPSESMYVMAVRFSTGLNGIKWTSVMFPCASFGSASMLIMAVSMASRFSSLKALAASSTTVCRSIFLLKTYKGCMSWKHDLTRTSPSFWQKFVI